MPVSQVFHKPKGAGSYHDCSNYAVFPDIRPSRSGYQKPASIAISFETAGSGHSYENEDAIRFVTDQSIEIINGVVISLDTDYIQPEETVDETENWTVTVADTSRRAGKYLLPNTVAINRDVTEYAKARLQWLLDTYDPLNIFDHDLSGVPNGRLLKAGEFPMAFSGFDLLGAVWSIMVYGGLLWRIEGRKLIAWAPDSRLAAIEITDTTSSSTVPVTAGKPVVAVISGRVKSEGGNIINQYKVSYDGHSKKITVRNPASVAAHNDGIALEATLNVPEVKTVQMATALAEYELYQTAWETITGSIQLPYTAATAQLVNGMDIYHHRPRHKKHDGSYHIFRGTIDDVSLEYADRAGDDLQIPTYVNITLRKEWIEWPKPPSLPGNPPKVTYPPGFGPIAPIDWQTPEAWPPGWDEIIGVVPVDPVDPDEENPTANPPAESFGTDCLLLPVAISRMSPRWFIGNTNGSFNPARAPYYDYDDTDTSDANTTWSSPHIGWWSRAGGVNTTGGYRARILAVDTGVLQSAKKVRKAVIYAGVRHSVGNDEAQFLQVWPDRYYGAPGNWLGSAKLDLARGQFPLQNLLISGTSAYRRVVALMIMGDTTSDPATAKWRGGAIYRPQGSINQDNTAVFTTGGPDSAVVSADVGPINSTARTISYSSPPGIDQIGKSITGNYKNVAISGGSMAGLTAAGVAFNPNLTHDPLGWGFDIFDPPDGQQGTYAIVGFEDADPPAGEYTQVTLTDYKLGEYTIKTPKFKVGTESVNFNGRPAVRTTDYKITKDGNGAGVGLDLSPLLNRTRQWGLLPNGGLSGSNPDDVGDTVKFTYLPWTSAEYDVEVS